MRRSFWLLLPALVLLALVVVPFGASANGPPSCAISNARTHKDYSSLQNAVGAAKAGDTLEVKGNCVGNTSVNKNITLKGITNKTFPGTPTLDGGAIGTVLHITNGTTTVDGLRVTNGVADVTSVEGNGCCVGGGIAVSGATAGAHLINTLVTANSAGIFGGGIDVDDGSLTLESSVVSGNTSSSSGGIDSDFGTVTLIDSAVSGNIATGGGTCTSADLSCAGAIWNFGGTLTLIDSTISGNSADDRGGGVVNQLDGAVLTLSGTSAISSNTAGELGGGIWIRSGTVSATADWTGSISGNTPDQCSPTVTIGSTICGP